MANSKQKPAPEGAQRKPGKTKFSLPRREAPPIDGSYLDRLFADYEQQTRAVEAQSSGTEPTAEAAHPEALTGLSAPLSTDFLPAELGEAVAQESSQPSPPEASVPFPETEVLPTDTEAISGLSLPQPPSAEVSTDIQSANFVTPSPPIAAPPPAFENDESLLETWKRRHRLSKGEVNVLRVMIRMCREAGGEYCYVKIPQLMADAQLKERQTQLVLRSLAALGLVEKLADYSNADRLGTKYQVFFASE